MNDEDRIRFNRIIGKALVLLLAGVIILAVFRIYTAFFAAWLIGWAAYQIGRYTEQDRVLPSYGASTLSLLIVVIPVVLLARAAKTFYSYTVEPSGFSAFGYVCIVYLVMISVFLSLGLFMREYARKREKVA